MPRPWMLVAPLVCGFASFARGQTSRSPVVVSTVSANGLPRAGDTTTDLVFVVRDLGAPAQPLQESWVGVGKAGTDVRRHPIRALTTRADGTARFSGLDTVHLDVVVLKAGYDDVRFPLPMDSPCGQTVEVYMRSTDYVRLVLGDPASMPRVVITGCTAPPSEPFRFSLSPSRTGPRGDEIRDATVTPPGRMQDSLPPAFQLRISPPPPGAPAGSAIHAVIRRGEPGMNFFLELIGTFGGPPSGSSGALRPIAIEPTDSVPLLLTRAHYKPDGSWTAVATVPNGGRFELFIDRTNRQGEFRSLGAADDDKVLRALAGVAAQRR